MLKIILLAIIAHAQLQNSLYVDGNADSNYLAGTDKMWPKPDGSRTIYPLAKGDRQLIYFRYLRVEAQTAAVRAYTGVFYPAVDDYSQLVIPNSIIKFNQAGI